VSWVKVDDGASHHPKLVAAGPIACWLWVCGLCYCNRYLTDGLIPLSAVATLGNVPNVKRHATQLCDAGLWRLKDEHHYEVVNYAEYQPSRAKVVAQREERQKAGRAGGIRSGAVRSKTKAGPEALASDVASDTREANMNPDPGPVPIPFPRQRV
jgi:hypothetical protein